MVTKIVKRDGRVVPFNTEKIAKAIYQAALSVGGSDGIFWKLKKS